MYTGSAIDPPEVHRLVPALDNDVLFAIDFWRLGLDNPRINAWFRGMYESFFDGLRRVGCCVTYSPSTPNRQADMLVVPLGRSQEQTSARAMTEFGGPVALYVPPAASWFEAKYLRCWKDQVLFAYGTDFSVLTRST